MKISTQSRSRSGSILIITLFILALLAVIVVGASISARLERSAASSHLQRAQASEFAQQGIERVVAALRQYTGNLSTAWSAAPGQLIVRPAGNASAPTLVPLNSGLSTDASAADLNIANLLNPSSYLLADSFANSSTVNDPNAKSDTHLLLQWVYVRQDGTLDFSVSPALNNTSNPIVGRYAYWTDNESSKVNYNLAWSSDPTVNNALPTWVSNPTRIDLSALPGSGSSSFPATNVHSYLTSNNYQTFINPPFNTPEDGERVSATVAAALEANKFSLTNYNHDSDLTYWGAPKIVLTTQKAYAHGQPFLDILTNPGTDTTMGADPGVSANLSSTKVNTAIKLLVQYLSRQDWPVMAGSSKGFQNKYAYSSADTVGGSNTIGSNCLAQLAVEIIDYVRCAESPKYIIQPLMVTCANGTFTITNLAFPDGVFRGFTRGLHMTEMRAWQSSTTTTLPGVVTALGTPVPLYKTTYTTEFYLPPHCGLDSLDFAAPDPTQPGNVFGLYTFVGGGPPGGVAASTGWFPDSTRDYDVASSHDWVVLTVSAPTPGQYVFQLITQGGGTVINAGEYAYIVQNDYQQVIPVIPYPWKLLVFGPRGAGTGADGANLTHFVPTGTPLEAAPWIEPEGAATATYQNKLVYSPYGSTDAGTGSLEVDDPFANGNWQSWHAAPAPGSFGLSNVTSTLGTSPSNPALGQDTDSGGKLTDVGYRLPYPKGDPHNPDGTVKSVAELGFLPTGISPYYTDAEVPWRTVRLQPVPSAQSGSVPDWALLDLFTVPKLDPTGTNSSSFPSLTATSPAVSLFMPQATNPTGNAFYFMNVGGRLNPNTLIAPWSFNRINPLLALFTDHLTYQQSDGTSVTLNSSQASTIAANVAQFNFVPGSPYLGQQYYLSPGELCEVKGIADTGEESEDMLRQIADIVTTQGNVFSIYSIGQSVKQTPTGQLVVTSEQRQHAIVERCVTEPTLTLTSNVQAPSIAVSFRVRYFRNLYP